MDYSVIKEGDLFFVTNKAGDIAAGDNHGYGLYTKDTRFLSQMELFIDDVLPELLSTDDVEGYVAHFRLMKNEGDAGAIEVARDHFIYDDVLYVKLTLANYYLKKNSVKLTLKLDSDFQDMFIVRGFRTGEVGSKIGIQSEKQKLSIGYLGADNKKRETVIGWDAENGQIQDGSVSFTFDFEPKEAKTITLTIAPVIDGKQPNDMLSADDALAKLEASYHKWTENGAKLCSDLPELNLFYERGIKDLRMLMTDVGYGDVPVAGLPWFAVPFGRDSLITALFMLPFNAELVKGTLRTLAAYQGTKVDPWRDEQPGKIMHEIRFGELATTNQSPFTPYYGSIDATPLFLVLLTEYVHWTNDFTLAEELLDNIERALEWIDEYGDRDKSGFLSYHQEAEKGFPNQGWKDSSNSMVHANGEYAKSPISLVEVQGYVYQAKKNLVPLMKALGKEWLAVKLEQDAYLLKNRVNEFFWMEDEKTFALALDAERRQVQSVTSNPGHLLMSGIVNRKRSEKVTVRLLAEDMYNGYGIRTMSSEAAGYYPMSYHNGSVWPHDNAMCLLGLTKLGFKDAAKKVIHGLLDASRFFEHQRLPEVFCGHDTKHLVPYPSTCSPQAWAAGVSSVLISTMLGLNPDPFDKTITLSPFLLDQMNELSVNDIKIGDGTLSVKITRLDNDSADDQFDIQILQNTTGYKIKSGT